MTKIGTQKKSSLLAYSHGICLCHVIFGFDVPCRLTIYLDKPMKTHPLPVRQIQQADRVLTGDFRERGF